MTRNRPPAALLAAVILFALAIIITAVGIIDFLPTLFWRH